MRQEDSRNQQTQLCSWDIYKADCTDDTRQSNKPSSALRSSSTGTWSPVCPASRAAGAGKNFTHPPTAHWHQDGTQLAALLLSYFPERPASVGKLPSPLPSPASPDNALRVSAGFYPEERRNSALHGFPRSSKAP